jgi:hypothetical protein
LFRRKQAIEEGMMLDRMVYYWKKSHKMGKIRNITSEKFAYVTCIFISKNRWYILVLYEQLTQNTVLHKNHSNAVMKEKRVYRLSGFPQDAP